MNRTKTPAAGGTATGARAEMAIGQMALSGFENSTNHPKRQASLDIADYLNTGEAAAVPMSHLRALLGQDSRTIRLEIEQARRRGVPICANNSTGYYIAESEQERARFVRSMRHRAAEIMETAEAVAKAALDVQEAL